MMAIRRIAILAAALLAAAQLVVAQSQSQGRSQSQDQTQSDEPPACVLADKVLAEKQPDLAVVEYDKCLSNNPPSFKALANLGIAYAEQEKFPEAIQSYSQALALKPQDPNVRLNLGLAYLKSNQPKQAADEFARSLIADPHNAKTLELLAYAHFALGDFALAAYEAGIVHQASPGDPSASYILGESYNRMGMDVQAIPLLVNSLSQAKSAEAYKVLGEAWLGVKNWPAALDAFKKAEKINPKLPGLYADMGSAQAILGQMDQAKADYLKEIAVDPESFKANYLLGQLDRVVGDNADAEKYLDKALELVPGATGPSYELAALDMQKQEFQKAEDLLEMIVKKDPSLTNAHVLLSEAYFRLGKTKEGMKERAISAALQKSDHDRLQAEGKALKWLSGGKTGAEAAKNP